MAETQIVAFKGIGEHRNNMTKSEAVRYLLLEKVRALQKFVGGVQPRRAPRYIARRDACVSLIEKIKSGALGKGEPFDMDEVLAAEQDALYQPDVMIGPMDIEAELKAILGPEA